MPFTKFATLINKRPLLANSIQTGLLFGTGDVLAQVAFPETKDHKYDYVRTLRGVIYGSLIFSPIATRLYKYLNDGIRFPIRLKTNVLNPSRTVRYQKLLDTGTRVSFDQLICAPVGIPLYFTCISIMENKSWDQLKLKLEENYWETLVNNWKVWPAFQMINFYFVPVQFRLLSVNIISILWNCYLSLENSLANKDIEEKKIE